MGRHVSRQEVPPKPVVLQGHQFAYQDMSNSAWCSPRSPGSAVSHHTAELPALIPQPPSMESPMVSGGTLHAELHLKAKASLDESHRCVKGSRIMPGSELRWMLQDMSSCPLFLTQLLLVSPLFSTCRPGSRPCTPRSVQPCLLLVPQHKCTPATAMSPRGVGRALLSPASRLGLAVRGWTGR